MPDGWYYGSDLPRGTEIVIARPHPMADKKARVTRTLDDGRICTSIGVVLRPEQVIVT